MTDSEQDQWITRTKGRIQRAIYRAIVNRPKDEWFDRIQRVYVRAWILGWVHDEDLDAHYRELMNP